MTSAERFVKQESEFGRCLWVLIDKFVLDCVEGEFGIRLHAHLLQYSGPVGANGAIAQRERGGDFANRFS
jgi:hypothetical protein